MLKKSIFILVPDFHGPTSQSGPVLRTMPFICPFECCQNYASQQIERSYFNTLILYIEREIVEALNMDSSIDDF